MFSQPRPSRLPFVVGLMAACSTEPNPPPTPVPPIASPSASVAARLFTLVAILGLVSCSRGSTSSPTPTAAVSGSTPAQQSTLAPGSPQPTPVPGASDTPGAAGPQIIFHSDPNGGSDFYLMNPDGSGLVRLTENFNTEAFATVSPNGRWLAFANRRNRDLYLVDLEAVQQGSGKVTPSFLTRSAQRGALPAWSPDSRKVAYVDDDTGHITWVELSGAEGSVAATFDTQAAGFEPAWLPDGTRLAFFSDRDGNAEIYVMQADGSRQIRLTEDPAADYTPRWSPDGQRLLFVSERDGNAEVYVMGADGSELLNVSDDAAHDEFAFWSPDGTQVVYVSYQDGADPFSIGEGNAEIFVVNVDGTGKTNLTANDVWDGDPAWSPDGEWIVFTQRVGDDHQGHIHVMRADGSQQTRLVGEPGEWNDCCAAWRPARPFEVPSSSIANDG